MNITSPYHFLEMLFTNRAFYKEVTAKQKSDNFFMINRILSIEFPLMANKLNVNGIDPVTAVDAWYYFIAAKNYKSMPRWVWTKFSSAHKKEKSKVFLIDKKIIKYFLTKNQISERELNEMIEFCEKDLLEELKFLEKHKDSL
jgi:hypothetical protein